MIVRSDRAQDLLSIIKRSAFLDNALNRAFQLLLEDWWISGGAIRDTVWAKLFTGEKASIKDIDLLYFDKYNVLRSTDTEYDSLLPPINGAHWSVKNQARMHKKDLNEPYSGVIEAVYFAPDTISTICLKRSLNSNYIISSSFGYDDLFNQVFRPTPHFMRYHSFDEYKNRVLDKGWKEKWPKAKIEPWSRGLSRL